MYEIGERVLYGIHGICTITAIERMRFGKERANYYVLEPKEQPGAKFYVPWRMRPRWPSCVPF